MGYHIVSTLTFVDDKFMRLGEFGCLDYSFKDVLLPSSDIVLSYAQRYIFEMWLRNHDTLHC